MTTVTTDDFGYKTVELGVPSDAADWGRMFFPTIELWTWKPVQRVSRVAVPLAKRYAHSGRHRNSKVNFVQNFKHLFYVLGTFAFALYHYAVVAMVLRGDAESKQFFWYALSLVCVAGSTGLMWLAASIRYRGKKKDVQRVAIMEALSVRVVANQNHHAPA